MKIEYIKTHKSFQEFLAEKSIFKNRRIEELKTSWNVGEYLGIYSSGSKEPEIRMRIYIEHYKNDPKNKKIITDISATGGIRKSDLEVLENAIIEYSRYRGIPYEEPECRIYIDKDFD